MSSISCLPAIQVLTSASTSAGEKKEDQGGDDETQSNGGGKKRIIKNTFEVMLLETPLRLPGSCPEPALEVRGSKEPPVKVHPLCFALGEDGELRSHVP